MKLNKLINSGNGTQFIRVFSEDDQDGAVLTTLRDLYDNYDHEAKLSVEDSEEQGVPWKATVSGQYFGHLIASVDDLSAT